jgi:hypothetical protein
MCSFRRGFAIVLIPCFLLGSAEEVVAGISIHETPRIAHSRAFNQEALTLALAVPFISGIPAASFLKVPPFLRLYRLQKLTQTLDKELGIRLWQGDSITEQLYPERIRSYDHILNLAMRSVDIQVGHAGRILKEGGALFCNIVLLWDPMTKRGATLHYISPKRVAAHNALICALQAMGKNPSDRNEMAGIRTVIFRTGTDDPDQDNWMVAEHTENILRATMRALGLHPLATDKYWAGARHKGHDIRLLSDRGLALLIDEQSRMILDTLQLSPRPSFSRSIFKFASSTLIVAIIAAGPIRWSSQKTLFRADGLLRAA